MTTKSSATTNYYLKNFLSLQKPVIYQSFTSFKHLKYNTIEYCGTSEQNLHHYY